MFPVTHSTLSQRALASDILPKYLGESTVECRLLVRGMNDSYLIRTEGIQYILRAYRHGHRTLPDIKHELELLKYLHEQGVGVSTPVVRKDGELVTEIMAPEGTRYVALFTYAPGIMRPLTSEIAGRYGQAVARLHQAMGSFVSGHQRYHIDLQHLLVDRVHWILPLLEHRPDDQTFVSQLCRFLHQYINTIAPALKWGLCHGDLNGGNYHIDNDGRVTFFDFDCEGPGWPAYDVAVFNWSIRDMPDANSAIRYWQAYLDSYQQVTPLSDSEIASIRKRQTQHTFKNPNIHETMKASQLNWRLPYDNKRTTSQGLVISYRGLSSE